MIEKTTESEINSGKNWQTRLELVSRQPQLFEMLNFHLVVPKPKIHHLKVTPKSPCALLFNIKNDKRKITTH